MQLLNRIQEWRDTADLLNNNGFEIEVSKLLENKEYEDGWDLVEYGSYKINYSLNILF
jgi:hypothetical protein